MASARVCKRVCLSIGLYGGFPVDPVHSEGGIVKRLVSRLAIAAAIAAPAVAFGQEAADEQRTQTLEAPVEAEVQKPEPSGPNAGKLSVSAGIDFTTAYFFRGYNQEDQGLIAQPYANIYAKLIANEDLTATAYVGTWNSLHS